MTSFALESESTVPLPPRVTAVRRAVGLPVVVSLLILLAPFQELTIPSLPLFVPFSWVAAVAAIAMWMGRRNGVPIRVVFPLLLVIGIAVLSILQTYVLSGFSPELIADYGLRGSRIRAWYQLGGDIFLLLTAFAVCYASAEAQAWKQILVLSCRVAMFVGLFSLYEVLAKEFNLPLVFPSIADYAYRSLAATRIGSLSIPRPYGTFFEPGIFASYSAHLAIIVIAVPANWLRKGEKLTASLALIGATLLTGTLPAIGLLIIGATRAGALRRFRSPIALLLSVAAVAFIVLQGLSVSGDLAEGLDYQRLRVLAYFGLADNPNESGAPDMRANGRGMALAAFADHPFLGVGLGNEMFYTRMVEREELAFGSGSTLVTLLTETGIIGFACVVVFGLTLRSNLPKASARPEVAQMAQMAKSLGFALMTSLLVRGARGGPMLFLFEMVTLGLLLRLTVVSDEWRRRRYV